MAYLATMESLNLKFQVSRSNGLAVVTIWSHEFSGHFSAIFVIHRKFAPYMYVCPDPNPDNVKDTNPTVVEQA